MEQTGGRMAVVMTLLAGFASAAVFNCGEVLAQTDAASDRTQSMESKAGVLSWDFDDVPVGLLPASWKVAGTNERHPLAAWQVVRDTTASSGSHVLAMTSPNYGSEGGFNVCWTDTVSFLDGEIQVRFKAVSGEEDQGGGVVWRLQDEENYYIARFNPLENNFRIYYVRDGARKTLADARIRLPAGKWHTLKIVQHGEHFEGSLNGKMLLEGTDELFAEPGGLGLWTKADAVTWFDDLRVAEREVSNRP